MRLPLMAVSCHLSYDRCFRRRGAPAETQGPIQTAIIVNSKISATTLTWPELEARLAVAWPDLVQFVLSQPRGGREATVDKISARVVHLKGGERVQLTHFQGSQQSHSNLTFDAALQSCAELLQSQFRRLHLFTTAADIEVKCGAQGEFSWRETAPTKVAGQTPHNRRKQYLIPEDEPCQFLIEIGVMNRDGKVLAAKYHKFRQINRFLELVDDVLPNLPTDREIQVVDFGSGKSYLTFALHHLLTRIRGRSARIVGVDRKADVIRACSRIATDLGCQGLSFEHGDIADFGSVGHVDLMVSLHACDTATDAALAQAVRWQTPVILAVPCCQHELATRFQPIAALDAISSHGILKDRFAALATDALRANVLELCGYQTQVVEFIDLEHTPKNLLIRAIRRDQPAARISENLERYRQFTQLVGIAPPYLVQALRDLLPAACGGQQDASSC